MDDCSSASVRGVVSRVCSLDARVQLLNVLERQGASFCRNLGAKQAQTEWLLFLDDDDLLCDNYLNSMDALIRVHPEVSAWIPNVQNFMRRRMLPVSISDMQSCNRVGGCSGFMIRKTLFDKVGGFDARLPSMQDWDLWIRLIERHALYYSGIEGVVYDFDSTRKITHNLKAKYLGLRRLYFKHFDARTRSVRRQHLVRAWALRQLLEPSGPRLYKCFMRILIWPKATIYYLKWYKFLSN